LERFDVDTFIASGNEKALRDVEPPQGSGLKNASARQRLCASPKFLSVTQITDCCIKELRNYETMQS
jgi:hypothetical protein